MTRAWPVLVYFLLFAAVILTKSSGFAKVLQLFSNGIFNQISNSRGASEQVAFRAHAGWELKGDLTTGKTRPLGEHDLGVMWECPFFVPLQPDSSIFTTASQDGTHVLCVSPYPHHLKDRPTNTCLYWTGPLDTDARFNLEQASGQHRCQPK